MHLHLLLFVDHSFGIDETCELWRWLHERWSRRVLAVGGRTPSLARGVQVLPCASATDALAGYLAKVGADGLGAEVARADGKTARTPGSRTPFQLLEHHCATGDTAAWRAWSEWVEHSRGRRAIEWSRGLRAQLLADPTEASDDELAAVSEPAAPVITIPRAAWATLLALRATVDVLEAAERGGPEAVVALLRNAGFQCWCDRRAGPAVLREAWR